MFELRLHSRFVAALLLTAIAFNSTLAGTMACCAMADADLQAIAEECHGSDMHAGHHQDGDADMTCSASQCCVMSAAVSPPETVVPALIIATAGFLSFGQIVWGDAVFLAPYLSRGPPNTALVHISS